ncbi:hypothetical protein ACF0H5_001056 [Mactra antiquata]
MLTQSVGPVTVGHGQGKRAVTLLTEGGCYYPIVSHYSYRDRQARSQSAPQNAGRIRGLRPMHQTTMTVTKPPWNPKDGYLTSAKKDFGGSKSLNPVRRPPLCPSMHRSQIKLGQPDEPSSEWNTHYTHTFAEKPIIPANRLHLTSLVNRIDQQEGADMKNSIKVDKNSPSYFTQYTRIHSKLGNMLGPGVPRDYPVRQDYNVITGETGGPSWQPENRRISGDKVLHGVRRAQTSLLG